MRSVVGLDGVAVRIKKALNMQPVPWKIGLGFECFGERIKCYVFKDDKVKYK